jgi:hypothetical protein
MAYVMEAGCIFHSVLIGLGLGVTVLARRQVLALALALTFHQMLEGVSLGAIVAASRFPGRKAVGMVAAYAVTTPLGVLLGVAVASTYDADGTAARTVQGVLNGVSAGMLLYISLIQQLSEDFTRSDLPSDGALRASMCAGRRPRRPRLRRRGGGAAARRFACRAQPRLPSASTDPLNSLSLSPSQVRRRAAGRRLHVRPQRLGVMRDVSKCLTTHIRPIQCCGGALRRRRRRRQSRGAGAPAPPFHLSPQPRTLPALLRLPECESRRERAAAWRGRGRTKANLFFEAGRAVDRIECGRRWRCCCCWP